MPDEPINYGVVNFMSRERFEASFHGRSREEREARAERLVDYVLAVVQNRPLPRPVGNPVGNWPCVQHAIYRGGHLCYRSVHSSL
jgi:hypothetical protein